MSEAEGGGIFVSYRRQESSHLAGRLYDRLTDRFGEGQVFMDVDAIGPGVDFAEEISRAVAACQVLLAVIGPSWLTATDHRGRRRLDDPDDIVRLEIGTALARRVLVIPILAEDAVMPGREDLPESLASLTRPNALHIRHESFRYDAGRLITTIEQVLAAAPGTVSQSPPTAKAEAPAVPHGARPDGKAGDEAARKDPEAVRNGRARTDLPGSKSAGPALRPGQKVPASKRPGPQAASGPTATPWIPQTQAVTLGRKGIKFVTFSPDGQLLASAGRDKKVRLWDPATGQQLRILTGHTATVHSVAFSPDGQLLASASNDDKVQLWEPATGQQLRTLTGHTAGVTSVAFSPDGRLLATSSGSFDPTVRLWDPATGQQLRTLPGSTAGVRSVAFSPDGRLLASGGYGDPKVQLWEPATGQQLRTLAAQSLVESVAFSPDGRLLASGGYDQKVQVWESATGQQLRVLTGHTATVYSVAFSPDGRQLASAGKDMTVLWR